MRFLGYEVPSPDGALPLFIGGGDRLGGEGVQMQVRSEEYPCGVLSAPSHHFVVPIDFASLIFLLLVRHSINKFILCSYLVRRFSL